MKKLNVVALLFLFIGAGLLLTSCNKENQTQPEAQNQTASLKNMLSSDIPWESKNWASWHKEGIAGPSQNGYPVGQNPCLGLDITDYLKEKLHNDPEVVALNGQFSDMHYYKLSFQEAHDLVHPRLSWYKYDRHDDLPEFYNEFSSVTTWSSSLLYIKVFIQNKLAELQAQCPERPLRVKYINFEQGHCSVQEEFPWMKWRGNVMGLTGFYFGTWEENTIDPDLQLASDIAWNNRDIAAMHKVGNLPNCPGDDGVIPDDYDFKTNELALLDASDYIEELCMLDPELIPQHGYFKSLRYYRLPLAEWQYMIQYELWSHPTQIGEDVEAYNEYHPASFWAQYHPNIKAFIQAKMQGFIQQSGNTNLKVKAINFDQAHFYLPYANQENPFITGQTGHFHSLYGFYYGEWYE